MSEETSSGVSRTRFKASLWILAALLTGFLLSFLTVFMAFFSSSALRHGGLI